MEGALILKLLLAAGGFAVWAYQQVKAKAERPAPTAMAAPPPIPRRVRKPRAAAPKAVAKPAAEPAEGPARPAPAVVPAVAPAPSAARARFRGVAALRQAVVAREVLGPPLCLRPPRV